MSAASSARAFCATCSGTGRVLDPLHMDLLPCPDCLAEERTEAELREAARRHVDKDAVGVVVAVGGMAACFALALAAQVLAWAGVVACTL